MNESEEQPQPETDNTELEHLKLALEDEKKHSEDYLTRLKYAQADIENLKKRFDRQLEEAKKYCTEPLIVELLDVLDELELAVDSGRANGPCEEIITGVEMTLSKLRKALKNEGVSPIESIGKPFDPSKHNAVARVEKENVEECTVVEELRKGYFMKEKVIRPSIVKVAVKPSSKPTGEVNPNE